MSQIITCPNCGQTYAIQAHQVSQYIGRSIQCTQCAIVFAVNLQPVAQFTSPPVVPVKQQFQQPSNYQPAYSQQPSQPQGVGQYSSSDAAVAPVGYATPAPAPKASGLAIASLVLACVGLLFAPLALVGIVLGIVALLKTRDQRIGGRGIAIAGISVGGASVVLSACLLSIMLPSLGRARETANRVKCASNLRQIGQAMLLYANDNRGQYPPTPDLLLLTQDIAPDAFCCPASDETPVSANLVQTARSTPNTALLTQGNTSYVYVGKGQTSSSSAEAILAYEMPANHDDDGCNFLYGDGHVSFELKASADAIIAEINAGNNPPRWNVVQQAVRNSRAKR